MKKRWWFLGLGIVLGILAVGLSFATNYNYITQKKSPWTTLVLKDASANQLTAQMWSDVIVAVQDIDLRLKALENVTTSIPQPNPTPVNGQCGVALGTCAKGSLIADNNATCGKRTWTCLWSNGGGNASCSKTLSPCAQPRKNCVPWTKFTHSLYPNTIFNLWWETLLDGNTRELVAQPTKLELPELNITWLADVSQLWSKPIYHVEVRCDNGALIFIQDKNTECPEWTTYSSRLNSCGYGCSYWYWKAHYVPYMWGDSGNCSECPRDVWYLCRDRYEDRVASHGESFFKESPRCPSDLDLELTYLPICVNGGEYGRDGKM